MGCGASKNDAPKVILADAPPPAAKRQSQLSARPAANQRPSQRGNVAPGGGNHDAEENRAASLIQQRIRAKQDGQKTRQNMQDIKGFFFFEN